MTSATRTRVLSCCVACAATLLAACDDSSSTGSGAKCSAADRVVPTSSGASCPGAEMVVAMSDYTSSELGVVAGDGGARWFSGGAALGKDPALVLSDGRLFWIDRIGGDVLELDPGCGTVLGGPWITSDPDAAGSTNPQDLAVDPVTGNLWIARFAASTLLVKSPDGACDLARIDLSGVTGVSRDPYMSSIAIVDGKAYVTLEMLDASEASSPTSPSYVVRLDVATAMQTGKIEATLKLAGRNPFGRMAVLGRSLYLAELGQIDAGSEADLGVERVDLDTFTSKVIVTEAEIGAKVDSVAVTSGCAAAIVMGPGPLNVTSLVTFDPDSGAIETPLSAGLLMTDAGFDLAGMAWLSDGRFVVGDRTLVSQTGYRLHLLERGAGCAFTEAPAHMYAPQKPVAIQPTP